MLFPSLFPFPPVQDCGKPEGLSMAPITSPLSLAAWGTQGGMRLLRPHYLSSPQYHFCRAFGITDYHLFILLLFPSPQLLDSLSLRFLSFDPLLGPSCVMVQKVGLGRASIPSKGHIPAFNSFSPSNPLSHLSLAHFEQSEWFGRQLVPPDGIISQILLYYKSI